MPDTSTSPARAVPWEHAKAASGFPWQLALGGLIVFAIATVVAGSDSGPFFAPVGIGLALTAWLGLWYAAPLGVAFFLVRIALGVAGFEAAVKGALLALEIAIAWWCYARLARAARMLDDPRSAVLFLLIIPGVNAGLCACLWILQRAGAATEPEFLSRLGAVWRAHALGVLILAPPLLAILTPVWLTRRWTGRQERSPGTGPELPADWTVGEAVEVGGLALAAIIVAVALAILQVRAQTTSWSLLGLSLLVVVWAALRQGLRGGVVAAGSAGLLGLAVAAALQENTDLLSLQGNFLAQCSVAILVGSSVGWIRASELRYRQIIGHIPVVLYSVRVPRWLPVRVASAPQGNNHRAETSAGSAIVQAAETTFVSPACAALLERDPAALQGPFALWLERILPEDREIVTAALAQLCLKKEPVTCEYRLVRGENGGGRGEGPGMRRQGREARDQEAPETGEALSPVTTYPTAEPARSSPPAPDSTPPAPDPLPLTPRPSPLVPHLWVRDTLAPHYSQDGHLDGWEGVVEDITEQRVLAHDLRHASAMLQAIVTHLPTGIYVVKAPLGQPILVNNRARQLLGQREDLAAGLEHLSTVYRLHRPDGSPYPWQELPVTKALREGSTTMATDVVVHRADGRHILLVSWAAPVDLGGPGQPAAAVWVLEDRSTLKVAEKMFA